MGGTRGRRVTLNDSRHDRGRPWGADRLCRESRLHRAPRTRWERALQDPRARHAGNTPAEPWRTVLPRRQILTACGVGGTLHSQKPNRLWRSPPSPQRWSVCRHGGRPEQSAAERTDAGGGTPLPFTFSPLGVTACRKPRNDDSHGSASLGLPRPGGTPPGCHPVSPPAA
jgi:hypothetical protein